MTKTAMRDKIQEILLRAPNFKTEICSGESYHGSSKGDKYEFIIYRYLGKSYYSLEDAKFDFVMHELGKEVEKIIKQK
jgi:hypothetical protein